MLKIVSLATESVAVQGEVEHILRAAAKMCVGGPVPTLFFFDPFDKFEEEFSKNLQYFINYLLTDPA